MRLRSIIMIFAALIVSAGTTLIARNWINGVQAKAAVRPAAEVAEQKARTQVLVAAAALPTGTFIKPNHLRWQDWPSAAVAATYIVRGKRKSDDFVGAVVRQGVAAGEPITDARIVKPGERGFLAAVLAPGSRAISVAVNATTGAAGFIFPGDRVDLILTHALRSGSGSTARVRRVSETAIQFLRVIAVDQRTDDQNAKAVIAKTVTLEVSPKQAEKVALLRELGKLSLSLRSLARPGSEVAPESVKPSLTWDSEASRVLGRPGWQGARKQQISVISGVKVSMLELAVRGRR